MASIKVLTMLDPDSASDSLAKLVKVLGFKAHSVRRYADFLSDCRRFDPDLLLLDASVSVEQIGIFANAAKRERKGLPILFIGDRKKTLDEATVACGSSLSFLPQDFDPSDLKAAIESLVEASKPRNHRNFKELDHIIVGQNPTMVELKRQVLRVGESGLTVLIRGESGTGKELIARAIHRFSRRSDKPMRDKFVQKFFDPEVGDR